jgi:hypothetical protein
VTIVNHIALLTVDIDEVDRVGTEFIGNHMPFSHARNDHVAISSIINMTHDQLPAGYVCRKARRINETVIGTRLR